MRRRWTVIRVPPPTRIPIGTTNVNGQRVELFLNPEWDRYFNSLTGQVNETVRTVEQVSGMSAASFMAEGAEGTEMPFFFPQPNEGGGTAVTHSVSLDFGPVSVPSKTFTFAHPGAEIGDKVLMSVASPGAGRDFDELEMDSLTCAADCLSSGVITVAIVAYPGPVSGAYNFNYQLG